MEVPRSTNGDRADFPRVLNRYVIRSDATGGRFALVEHEILPRALAAPVRTRQHEDECGAGRAPRARGLAPSPLEVHRIAHGGPVPAPREAMALHRPHEARVLARAAAEGVAARVQVDGQPPGVQ